MELVDSMYKGYLCLLWYGFKHCGTAFRVTRCPRIGRANCKWTKSAHTWNNVCMCAPCIYMHTLVYMLKVTTISVLLTMAGLAHPDRLPSLYSRTSIIITSHVSFINLPLLPRTHFLHIYHMIITWLWNRSCDDHMMRKCIYLEFTIWFYITCKG